MGPEHESKRWDTPPVSLIRANAFLRTAETAHDSSLASMPAWMDLSSVLGSFVTKRAWYRSTRSLHNVPMELGIPCETLQIDPDHGYET